MGARRRRARCRVIGCRVLEGVTTCRVIKCECPWRESARASTTGPLRTGSLGTQAPGTEAPGTQAPSTHPPTTSTHHVLFFVYRPHLTAAVVPAVRADAVRRLRFVAVRALTQAGRLQRVVRAALGRPRFGMSSFWIGHFFAFSGCRLRA